MEENSTDAHKFNPMQILVKARLFRHEVKCHEMQVEMGKNNKPPDKIVWDGGIYYLYSIYQGEAKYLLGTIPDPECVFCHQLESKATKRCPVTPGGEHDFDDIPF